MSYFFFFVLDFGLGAIRVWLFVVLHKLRAWGPPDNNDCDEH